MFSPDFGLQIFIILRMNSNNRWYTYKIKIYNSHLNLFWEILPVHDVPVV